MKDNKYWLSNIACGEAVRGGEAAGGDQSRLIGLPQPRLMGSTVDHASLCPGSVSHGPSVEGR